jgi:hypothetical protein
MQWSLLLLRGSWVFPFLADVPAVLGHPRKNDIFGTLNRHLNVFFMETL